VVDLGHASDLDRATGKTHRVGGNRVVEAAHAREHPLCSIRRNDQIDIGGRPRKAVDGHGQSDTDGVVDPRRFQRANEGRELWFVHVQRVEVVANAQSGRRMNAGAPTLVDHVFPEPLQCPKDRSRDFE